MGLQIFCFSALSELFMSMFFEMESNNYLPIGKKVIPITIITHFLTPFGTRLGVNFAIDYNSIGRQSEFIHSTNVYSIPTCVKDLGGNGEHVCSKNTSLEPALVA